MLESITLTRHHKLNSIQPLDIGSLIECMIFYEKTTVIADFCILDQLFRYFGPERLLRLLKEEYLHIIYVESHVGIITKTENNIEHHVPTLLFAEGHTFQNKLREVCIATPRKIGNARRMAQKLERHIRACHHDPLILEGAQKSLFDERYIESSARIIIKELAPNLLTDSVFLFKTHQTNKGTEIQTNLDFKKLNELNSIRSLETKELITPASILSHIIDLEAELYFAATNLSDISCSDLNAQLATNKIDYIFNRSKKNSVQLDSFKQGIFINANCIREAANANQLDLDYLFTVLEKSKRLKETYLTLPPETNLLQNYHDEITRDTVFQSLPIKLLRCVIFTGVGLGVSRQVSSDLTMQAIAAGSLEAFDAFFLDKLFAGWKPNQFINRDIKKLIGERP